MNGLQSTLDQGIVIAVDDSYELYLPWWWEHYSNHCSLPVTIIDLGMTESARLYSLSKGTVIPFFPETSFITPKEEIAPELIELWENYHSDELWEKRPLWFAKPFYLQKSPYKKTLYMDIDCKVQGPITPLLDSLPIDAFSLVKHTLPEGIFHNSGVLAFGHQTPILDIWAQRTLDETHFQLGDDDVLRTLIDEKKYPVSFFPLKYNTPLPHPSSSSAIISHYLGPHGKRQINLC